MKNILLYIIVSLLMLGTTFAYERNATQDEMLIHLNGYRASQGVAMLTGNDFLMKSAQDFACKMAAGLAPYAHVETDGTTPQDRMIAAGYRGVAFGENLGNISGTLSTSAMAIYSRSHSPGHKANMVNPLFNEAGLGHCGNFWVQNFGKSQPPTIINTGANTTTTSTNTTTNTVNTNTTTYLTTYMDEDGNILTQQEYLNLTNEGLSPSNNVVTSSTADIKSELEIAVDWMYSNGLTSKSNVTDFLPDNTMTREEASKFFSVFAKMIYDKSENSATACNFYDIKRADPTLTSSITSACKLGIFKGYKGNFSPKDKLDNAQAVTVLMRIMVGQLVEPTKAYYTNYLTQAQGFDLIGNIDPNNNITRGEAAILLYKANVYKEKLNNTNN